MVGDRDQFTHPIHVELWKLGPFHNVAFDIRVIGAMAMAQKWGAILGPMKKLLLVSIHFLGLILLSQAINH